MKYITRGKARLLLMALLLLLPMQLAVPCAGAEEARTVRVAFPQAEGYSMTAEDGCRYGLVVDVLDEVSKYTGWKYEYIDVGNMEILSRFQAGEFDLMGGQYYMEGLEQSYGYPDYNCGYSKLVLTARKDDPTIKSYDLRSLNGKTIGVFDRAQENIRRLKIYLELNDIDCAFQSYTYDQIKREGDLNQHLRSGEVDLLLSSSAANQEDFYVAATFDSQPHYIVTQPDDQELLDELNLALGKIYESNPNFAREMYEKNFPATANLNARLSAEEEEYIAGTERVMVAVPRQWHPLVCFNNSNQHDGFVPDILKEVTAYSGLAFEYQFYDSYAQALEALQQGQADVLGFIWARARMP